MSEENREEQSCMESNPAGDDAPTGVNASEDPQAARVEEERLEAEYAALESEEG